ncbi:MAG TPA: M20/M25/M40 family metallo-hydrolase [Pyrinomonadaceae bacterium]|nr:M20/M25/M40 family metallo-hydrolase [Pyrinomonadaceae bacterium]
MAETNEPQEGRPPARDLALPRGGFITAFLTLLFIALFAALAVREHLPPPAADAGAPATEFSAARALKHVEQISRRPHPVGSEEHARVREYILGELSALGVAAEVQEAEVMSPFRASISQMARLKNVVARLEGSGDGKALMLVGHYDTVPTSIGASDDGSAVGALLETLRALKAGPPLKNDVIFLFTDGEEVGLIGAKAFSDSHPWAKDVGLVLNFEARGTAGPSLLFETSDENGWLAGQFGKAVPRPVASSVFSEVYRFLPNMTDLTVFRIKGYSGLNFAFVGGLAHYHALSDNVANIDPRSLQHQGSYALSLSRHFGELSLENVKERNRVFFNTVGSAYVHYSEAWVMPLVYLASLLFVGALFVGFRKKLLTASGLVVSFFAHLGVLVATLVIVSLVSMVVRAVHSDYRLILQGATYNNHFYVIAGLTMTVAVAVALYGMLGKHLRLANLVAGALAWWVLLTVASGLYLPGASYVFTIPLLFVLVAVVIMFAASGDGSASQRQAAVFYVCSIPAITLSAPLIYLLALGLSASMFRIALAFVVLLLALLLPLVRLMSAPKRWLVPGVFALACVASLVAGSMTAGFHKNEPRPTNLFYVLNADTGKAIWASSDKKLNEWTSRFIPEDAPRGPISDYMPTPPNMFMLQRGAHSYWSSQASAVPLDAPHAEMIHDRTDDGTRILRIRVTSRRQATVVSVFVESDTLVESVDVNGLRRRTMPGGPAGTPPGPASGPPPPGSASPAGEEQPPPGGIPRREMRRPRWSISYHAPLPEGFEVGFEIKSPEPLRIRVVDQTYELPAALLASYPPAPDYMMPTPYPFDQFGGATFVSKSFNF